jgi:hypothetical protein
MKARRIAALVALLTGAGLLSEPSHAGETRAVIELFTSQGCSSCPPADKLLGELARDPSIIAMSLPVDYWDYLGWKDTLALHGHTTRQRAYSLARGDREVYTPQVVVNGVVHVLGSDKAAIERAIAQTRQNATALSLPVSMAVADGKVSVSVASASSGGNAEIWLCPITLRANVQIGRGENTGRVITYNNVVRRWVKLGVWSGKAETFTLPLVELPTPGVELKDIDSLAVVVQSGAAAKPGVMLGAASVALR